MFYGDPGYCVAWARCKKARALGRTSVGEDGWSRAEEVGVARMRLDGVGAGRGGAPRAVGFSVEPRERGGKERHAAGAPSSGRGGE